MKTSEFSTISDALNEAVDRSHRDDVIVTLWIDDSTIDEAIDAIRKLTADADFEVISANHVDAWGIDWRVIVRLLT
jgi:hypothetical protein